MSNLPENDKMDWSEASLESKVRAFLGSTPGRPYRASEIAEGVNLTTMDGFDMGKFEWTLDNLAQKGKVARVVTHVGRGIIVICYASPS